MTVKNLIKSALAIAIIVAGAAIGWAVATNTNPYAPTATGATAVANVTSVPNTPLATFTPASAATTPGAAAPVQAGASTTPGATGRTPGQGQGQRSRPITGTVSSYDAATKVLTVKDTDGKEQKFALTTARLTKSEKVVADDFAKLAASGTVIVNGTKNSDGSYTARSLTAVDPASLGGFGGGQGQAANTTPGAGSGFGGNGGQGGFGGGAGGQAPVILRGGTLNGTTFTGSSFAGDNVTVTLTDSTTLTKQLSATPDDLKAGTNVIVNARGQAQGDTPLDAQSVALS